VDGLIDTAEEGIKCKKAMMGKAELVGRVIRWGGTGVLETEEDLKCF